MVEPQPTKIPIWNTGGSNRTEPLTAEKTSGWAIDDQPPSSYFNWLQYYTGAWITWLNERVYKGTNEVDLWVNALQPDSSGAGGDLTMKSGPPNTTGASGAILIQTPDGITGAGGITILGGNATTSGDGAGISITAGNSPGGGNGGDIEIYAGQTTGQTGGNFYASAGRAFGTNRDSGVVEISTGASTGTGGGNIAFYVAEDGASGSGTNAPTPYLLLEGRGQSRRMYAYRHTRFLSTTATDPARGSIQLVSKTQPTTPIDGDIYPDATTDQLRMFNGSTYRGLNPKVYATSADSLSVDDVGGGEKKFQLSGPVDLKFTIPASYISAFAGIRVRAAFERSGTLVDEPGFRIRLGSYSGGTGVLLTEVTANGSSSTYVAFSIDLEVHIVSGGGTGSCRARTVALAVPTGSTWTSPASRVEERLLTSIAFNGALDIYPSVVWNAGGGGGQSVLCSHFTVDVI